MDSEERFCLDDPHSNQISKDVDDPDDSHIENLLFARESSKYFARNK